MPKKYIVQEGDSIPSIAIRFGLFPETIWKLPENQELREKRGNMNVLMPDDIVVVPDKEIKEVSKASDNEYVFVRKGTPALFRLQLFDGEEPLKQQKYILTVDGKVIMGKTDDYGVLQHHLPPSAKNGKLSFPGTSRSELTLDFGNLDPQTEIVGVQKRLNNLGFYCGTPDNKLNKRTKEALLEFQRRFELKETGEADAATVAKLVELHDKDELFPPKKEDSTAEGAIDNAFAKS